MKTEFTVECMLQLVINNNVTLITAFYWLTTSGFHLTARSAS